MSLTPKKIPRKKTRPILLGGVPIGGGAPVVIQSMTNTKTADIAATLAQIQQLGRAGAQIVRLAVLDDQDARSLDRILEQSSVPLVADIHFDYRLALQAIKAGIHGLRLNPGNIQERDKVSRIVEQAAPRKIPIRIGVNGGSLDRRQYPAITAENMVRAALEHIKILENLEYYEIKVSLKASDILTMVEAYRIFSQERDYPLHLGVTEAGPMMISAVRSAIGIGTLLMEGLGDTIRVSVSGDPCLEIPIAQEILVSLGLKQGIKFIACPTCGRTVVDVEKISSALQRKFKNMPCALTVAVMGCVVNGPGEAKDADIALVGGLEESLIYVEGLLIKKIKNNQIETAMTSVIEDFIQRKKC